MKPLNDTQRIILATANGRDDGSIMPLPVTRIGPADRARKAIAGLLTAAYVEEGEVHEVAHTWRQDGEVRVGLRITNLGRAAIGDNAADGDIQGSPVEVPVVAIAPKVQTKTAIVLELLRRGDGATLAELATATGWLPHTTRAALTGLRKKNHPIEKVKRGEQTCYRIVSAA